MARKHWSRRKTVGKPGGMALRDINFDTTRNGKTFALKNANEQI